MQDRRLCEHHLARGCHVAGCAEQHQGADNHRGKHSRCGDFQADLKFCALFNVDEFHDDLPVVWFQVPALAHFTQIQCCWLMVISTRVPSVNCPLPQSRSEEHTSELQS